MSKFPEDLFPIETPDAAGEYQFLGIVPYAMNEALVFLSKEVVADDIEGFNSANNVRNWSVVPVDPRIPLTSDPTKFYIPDGEVVATYEPDIGIVTVDEDDPKQLHLFFTSSLESGVRYDVTMSSEIRGPNCEALTGEDTRRFKSSIRGLGPVPRFVQEDVYRDFDMQFFPSDPNQPPGTWRYDTTSDIGIQREDESLKKRLYRRLFTPVGGFKHLGDGYGVDMGVKKLARSGELQRLASDAAIQARLEPDVIDASATTRLVFASNGQPLVELIVTVIRQNRTSSRFTFRSTQGDV